MTKAKRAIKRFLPSELEDHALIDAKTCAATGGMSLSWWQNEVLRGRAPAPVFRKPRCTRWRLLEVRDFWVNFAKAGAADIKTSDYVKTKAKMASDAAASLRLISNNPET